MNLVRHRNIVDLALRVAILSALAIQAIYPAHPALAQNSSAAVTGTVVDSSGAKIPGAKVLLKNVATNVVRASVSNDAGDYSFVSVPPARYTLIISATTFQAETISPFDVAVAQVVNIPVTLKPGNVNTVVTVSASGTQVESTTSLLGTVIGSKEVNTLPLNGRNFTQLLELTPGATPISVAQNSTSGNTAENSTSQYMFPSINGQRNRDTTYLVDGLNDNNSWYNTYAVPPIIDTVQEFKIASGTDASYGQVTGGIVNVITKAGTNDLHGTAWEFLRNNDFDAKTYFPSASNLYHENQFGAQVGGPVIIPHLYDGHNKTFFEFGFEGFRYSKASQSYYLQPTAAQLGESTWGGPQNLPYGDFSSATTGIPGCGNTASTSTAKCQLYDPTGDHNASSNRPAYVGNQIPVSEMDPYAVKFINSIFSAPITVPGFAPTTYNGEITTPARQATYNYSIRFDQHIGTRDFIFAKFADWQEDNSGPSSIPHLFSDTLLLAQQYGINWLHIFSPTFTMQAQYGKTHVEYNSLTQFDIPNIANIYGLSPAFSQSFIGGITILPTLAITGGFSGGEVNSPSPNEGDTHEWLGSVTKIMGRHTIQAGGGWDEINYGELIRQGQISFTGASTANFVGNPGSTVATGQSSQSGYGLADFLLDQPNIATKRNVDVTLRPGGIGSAFLQDSWRATANLTVNYGLRYDRTAIPQFGTDATIGQQGSIETGDFDFNTGNYILQVAPPTCADRGHAPCLPSAVLPAHVVVALNKKILKSTKTNFGPRFGLAYRVNSGLALRGGFGITYNNWAAATQLPQNYQGSWPDIGTLESDSLNTPGSAVYTPAQNPFGTSSADFPVATPFTSGNVNYFVDPEMKNPYTEQWNVGFEQQLGQHTIASMNYVGSESHRLDIGGYYNTGTLSTTPFATRQKEYAANPTVNYTGQPFPYTVPNRWDRGTGSGSYHALQTSLTRRTSNGLAFNAAYTWSKAIDEGMSEYFGAGTGASLEDPYNPRGSRSVAGFDIPQLLTLGLVYAVPVGRNSDHSSGNPVVDYILGGWEVGTIYVMRSGQNFSVSSAGDIGNTGNASTYERANQIGSAYLAHRSQSEWFNTDAFTTPASGTLGDSGRNILKGQTYNQMDASLTRLFPIHESLNFQLRVDAFNALNHPVLNYPAAATTTPATFGQVTSVATGNTQRLLQFSAKIEF